MIRDGFLASSDEVLNNCVGTPFRNYAQLLYNASYIGFNSKLNVATGVPNLKNIKYDVFNSDTAFYWNGFEYYTTDKLYRTQDNTAAVDYYLDIYANTGATPFTNNNCIVKEIARNINGTSIYRVYCTTGVLQVKRASIFNSLFLLEKIKNFTNIIAIKTTDANDVGLKFVHLTWALSLSEGGGSSPWDVTETATFSDTSTNTKVVFWGTGSVSGGANMGFNSISTQCPSGTNIDIASNVGTGGASFDTRNTDTTAKDKSNPSTFKVKVSHQYNDSGVNNRTYSLNYIVGYKAGTLGSFTFANTGATVNSNTFTDERFSSVAISGVIDYNKDIGTFLTFKTTSLPTIKDCIATWNSEIDGDNTLTVSISADGTNYEEVTDATIHRFTNTGTNLYVKFEIDRVDNSAVDKISEYGILYNVTNA